jgi:hypothetical protein
VLSGCGGRTDGLSDDEIAPAPPMLPACPGVPTAPADRDPAPATELARAARVASVAVDDSELFFASAPSDFGSTKLQAVLKTGGTPRPVADAMAYQLVIDGDAIYVGGSGHGLQLLSKATGERRHTWIDVFDFAVDGEYLYTSELVTNGVYCLGKDGTQKTPLAQGAAPQGISVRDGFMYWANYKDKNVARVSVSGGATQILHTFSDYTRSVIADCRYIYISVGNYGEQTYRMPINGGEATLFANIGGTMTIDAASLYVQNRDQTSRVSLTTGKVTVLDRGSGSGVYPSPLTVDNDAVYWTNGTGVMRAAK